MVDVDQDGLGRGPYLHTKIWVDISKPLIYGSLINIEGKITWIPLKYERSPNFCFYCSIIKHPKSGCPKGSSINKIYGNDQTQYGP